MSDDFDPTEASPEELREKAKEKVEQAKQDGEIDDPDMENVEEEMSNLSSSSEDIEKRRRLVERFTAAGWTAGAIANIFNVTERTIRNDLKEIRERNRQEIVEMGEDHASFEEIGDVISKYDIMAEEMFRMFYAMKRMSDNPDDYFDNKLAALKEARQFLSEKTDLLRRTGIFPDREAIEAMFVDNRQVVMEDNDKVPDKIKKLMDNPEKRMQVRKMLEKFSSNDEKAEKLMNALTSGESEEDKDVVDADTT